MNIGRLIVVWLGVLAATTMLTWQIVSIADTQVNARPVELTAPGTTTTTRPDTAPGGAPGAGTTVPSAPTTVPGETTGSSGAGEESPTTTLPAGPTPSTTAPAVSTEPDGDGAEADEWTIHTVLSGGGLVVVRYRQQEVELQAATPVPGFRTVVEEVGPPTVSVGFVGVGLTFEVTFAWDDEELLVDVDETAS